jgi:hypothetical protein
MDRWWKPLSRRIGVARNARMCGKRSFDLLKGNPRELPATKQLPFRQARNTRRDFFAKGLHPDPQR